MLNFNYLFGWKVLKANSQLGANDWQGSMEYIFLVSWLKRKSNGQILSIET